MAPGLRNLAMVVTTSARAGSGRALDRECIPRGAIDAVTYRCPPALGLLPFRLCMFDRLCWLEPEGRRHNDRNDDLSHHSCLSGFRLFSACDGKTPGRDRSTGMARGKSDFAIGAHSYLRAC